MLDLIYDMPEADYRADPCHVPSLSHSTAATMISRSDYHAYREHPRLGGKGRASTKQMDEGRIVHSLLLRTPIAGAIETGDYDSFRTNKAKDWRDSCVSRGVTPVLSARMGELLNAEKHITRRLRETFGIELCGRSEVTGLWESNGVQCRCRMDHLILDQALIWDVKTTESANPTDIPRHMVNFGEDIQWATYTEFLETRFPELEGRARMGFLYCEIEPPYMVVPAFPAESMKDVGKSKWNRAKQRWAKCMETGKWPGYVTEPIRVECPAYAYNREMGDPI